MVRFVVLLLLVLVLSPAATAEPRQAPSIHGWLDAVLDWLFAWIGDTTEPGGSSYGPVIIVNGAQAPPAGLGSMIIVDGAQAPPAGLGPMIIVNGVQAPPAGLGPMIIVNGAQAPPDTER